MMQRKQKTFAELASEAQQRITTLGDAKIITEEEVLAELARLRGIRDTFETARRDGELEAKRTLLKDFIEELEKIIPKKPTSQKKVPEAPTLFERIQQLQEQFTASRENGNKQMIRGEANLLILAFAKKEQLEISNQKIQHLLNGFKEKSQELTSSKLDDETPKLILKCNRNNNDVRLHLQSRESMRLFLNPPPRMTTSNSDTKADNKDRGSKKSKTTPRR